MQVDGLRKGKTIVEEHQDQLTPEEKMEGVGDYGWVRAGSRRGRGRGGGGRGGGRGRDHPEASRKKEELFPGDTSLRGGTNRGQAMVNSSMKSTRGGRGGFHSGGARGPRDGMDEHCGVNPTVQNQYLENNPNTTLIIQTSDHLNRRPSSPMETRSGYLPVGDPHCEKGVIRPLPMLTATSSSDLREEGPVKPRLITSRSKEPSQERSREPSQERSKLIDDHERLVDRISSTIMASEHSPSEENQPMDLERPDSESGGEPFDDNMPLALVQSEAKMEALARRSIIKPSSSKKKGRVAPLIVKD
ncbi:hypothetical protein J5N97_006352 [Dioscorea zingiberensis]|uniref:Uncharacterized protein n=1 Tax=Dioscorea zingiberensis TaxID=325984 RepID=A0A9D5D9V1_9LILI|nr:hypothetical protein J5N97_006352 [Dioscorea zingiberensis]